MTTFDNLALLRAFVCIVETGSISAGARRMKITQPSLSRYLQQLEELSGGLLIRRHTHGMTLTEMGHRLLADAHVMLAHAEEAQQRLREGQTSLRGHLRLFSSIDSGQFTVTRLITSFLQINEGVTAELAFTNRPMHMIQEGCDVGIIPGRILDDSVVARPAGKIALYLAASPALIKSRAMVKKLADLKSWPWVGLSGIQFWSTREVVLHGPGGAEDALTTSPILVSEGVTSIREAVRAGLGVAVLPHWLIREDIQSGRLERVLPKWSVNDLPVHVVYGSQRMLPVRVRTFVDFACSYLSNELR